MEVCVFFFHFLSYGRKSIRLSAKFAAENSLAEHSEGQSSLILSLKWQLF